MNVGQSVPARAIGVVTELADGAFDGDAVRVGPVDAVEPHDTTSRAIEGTTLRAARLPIASLHGTAR
jgi:hypothetical protein